LPLWIRPFLTTSEESQLGQVRGDIQDPTKHLFLYPYISRTTNSRIVPFRLSVTINISQMVMALKSNISQLLTN
jgi:hypothetical protein